MASDRVPDVLICTSPKAGSGAGREGIGLLVDALRAAGKSAEVTTEIGRVRQFALADAGPGAATGRPMIVTAGGDGTLALVAQNTPTQTVLVPMPRGTENLLARHFQHSRDVRRIVETILHGRDHAIDAGFANEKMFLVMVSCGFDAEVVRAMHLKRRGHISRLSYAYPIVRTIAKYRFSPLEASFPGDGDDCSVVPAVTCRWAMVFNLPRYAAGLQIEPSACDDDGQLNFCGLRDGSILSGVRYLGGIVTGRHIKWSDVTRRPVTQVRITSPDRVAYQLDGDYAGRLPLDIRIIPKYVTLRLPPHRTMAP